MHLTNKIYERTNKIYENKFERQSEGTPTSKCLPVVLVKGSAFHKPRKTDSLVVCHMSPNKENRDCKYIPRKRIVLGVMHRERAHLRYAVTTRANNTQQQHQYGKKYCVQTPRHTLLVKWQALPVGSSAARNRIDSIELICIYNRFTDLFIPAGKNIFSSLTLDFRLQLIIFWTLQFSGTR